MSIVAGRAPTRSVRALPGDAASELGVATLVESALAEDVAETWQAMQTDRFLVLPHPEVARWHAARATESDRWLEGMDKLQHRLEQAEVQA